MKKTQVGTSRPDFLTDPAGFCRWVLANDDPSALDGLAECATTRDQFTAVGMLGIQAHRASKQRIVDACRQFLHDVESQSRKVSELREPFNTARGDDFMIPWAGGHDFQAPGEAELIRSLFYPHG